MSMNNSIRARSPLRAGGLSLIEMMVALVAGLVVIGSVLAFTVATVRSYNENIRSTRLTNDLRLGMNLAVREIRRAGFDSASVGRIFSTTSPSSFSSLTVDTTNDCVIYRYDRGIGSIGDAPAATELRGLRLNSGAGTLQMDATSNSISCTGTGSSWVDVTDSKVVNITRFDPVIQTCRFCVTLDTRTVGGTTEYDLAQGVTRNLLLSMDGSLRSDPTLSRSIVESVRIRAEDVTFPTGSLVNCPAVPQECSTP